MPGAHDQGKGMGKGKGNATFMVPNAARERRTSGCAVKTAPSHYDRERTASGLIAQSVELRTFNP
jgi:hypothetical protein